MYGGGGGNVAGLLDIDKSQKEKEEEEQFPVLEKKKKFQVSSSGIFHRRPFFPGQIRENPQSTMKKAFFASTLRGHEMQSRTSGDSAHLGALV